MSLTPIGSASDSIGPTYNFTNATNLQFVDELEVRAKQGAISQEQATTAFALATFRGTINPDGTISFQEGAQAGDSSTHNFLTDFQNIDYNGHHTPGEVGAQSIDTILNGPANLSGPASPGSGRFRLDDRLRFIVHLSNSGTEASS